MVLDKVSVTGASGMLGTHVVETLRKAGAGVNSVTRSSWDLFKWADDATLKKIFGGSSAIVHAAALVPHGKTCASNEQLFDANVRATSCLGNWARRNNIPMVFISGTVVYKDQTSANHAEDAPLGFNSTGNYYGYTKLLAEDCLRRERDAGLAVSILRPSSIWGVGLRPGKLIPNFLNSLASDGTIHVEPPYDDSINLIHARDVASAVFLALQNQAWDVFNICNDTGVTVLELAHACINSAGRGRVHAPSCPAARQPVSRLSANSEKAKMVLGWAPQVTLESGIKEMLGAMTRTRSDQSSGERNVP